ncbi:INT10-like protein, partial [Mya arenaria]
RLGKYPFTTSWENPLNVVFLKSSIRFRLEPNPYRRICLHSAWCEDSTPLWNVSTLTLVHTMSVSSVFLRGARAMGAVLVDGVAPFGVKTNYPCASDWLVMRARGCFKTDPYAAKAWMLTAQSLFPHSFNIQFEAYSLEKLGKNSKEAAKLLEGLYSSFPEDRRLWSEVHSILEALQNEKVLAAIPAQVQCQMLLSVAERITDKLEQCRLLLLVLRKFPALVKEHGLKLVDSLLAAESFAKFQSPVNCYRKLLVCDVLPLVLQKGSGVKMKSSNLYLWLQKSVEFYISFITTPPSASEPATPLSPDLLSPTKTSRRAKIPGLQDREAVIPDPWASLYKLLYLIGHKQGWALEKDFYEKSREYQWQHILGVFNRAGQGGDTWSQQILYTTTVLFLECLYHYICSVDPDAFHTTSNANSVPLVIIEGFKSEQASSPTQPAVKRLKAESLLPQVHAIDTVPCSQRFVVLCTNWRMETWSWMGHFQTDMFLYQGAFQDAVRHLQNYSIGSKTKLQIRHSLQLACCYYCLSNYSKACELILDVISALPSSPPEPSDTPSTGNQYTFGSGRHLVLAPCSELQMIPYCIQMLITCFKEKAFAGKSDALLGHMLVLLQFDWPVNEELFAQIVKKIQKQGSFTYTQQRTVTRGVNKGVTEDFKVMMEKQVRRSEESVEDLVRQFLANERAMLLSSLV